jgi:SAM-dependent methyltransferase
MTSRRFDLASAGFAGGERYERARPGYPADAIAALCAACGIEPGRAVLDLAAGTGKLTREFVACGAHVTAVEPVAGMREQLAATVPGIQIIDGTAERVPVDDASVDVVTVGQAFHWFDGPVALKEIHRVLVPGGAIGLVWNVMDRSVPWVGRVHELIHRHRGPNPWYSGHAWRATFTPDCGFGALQHRVFVNTQPVDIANLVDRVASISFIATLPDGERSVLMDDLRQIVAEELPGQARFAIPYVTDIFWSHRVA